MLSSRPRPATFLAALFAISARAAASTLTVDDSGGADFTTIQAAIAAAAEGDVIVVRPGSYGAFTVTGKSLVIRGEGAAVVSVVGPSNVTGLSAVQSVEIAGMTFSRPAGAISHTFGASANAGVLSLRDCVMRGSDGILALGGQQGQDATSILNSAHVVVHSSSFHGGRGADYDPWIGSGGMGLVAGYSDLFVLHSTSVGGDGGEDFDGDEDGGFGGDGASFFGATVRAAHSTFRGGRGGYGGFSQLFGECQQAGAGGDAVQLASSSFGASDVTYAPGARGSFVCGQQPPPTGLEVANGTAAALAFTPYCFGFEAACPCGNRGFGIAGCDTSFATGGGRLEPTGTPSVSADSVSLTALGLPPGGTAILFQGTNTLGTNGVGQVFGDGLRCAGGQVRRLGSHAVSLGTTTFGPVAGDAPISVSGAIPAGGGAFRYQVWFRNAASYCTASTFNLTHGLEVDWSS